MSPFATRPLVRSAVVFAAVATVAGLAVGSLKLVLAAFALLALAGGVYLGTFATPALLISLALAAEVLNGNAKLLHFPIAPDRVLFAAAFAALILRLPGVSTERSIVWRPVHALVAGTAAYGVVSALQAHTLTTNAGMYALLDRLGIIPFAVFTLAPLVFGSRRARNTLLVVLVCLGAYLGLTAVFEGIGLKSLVFPSYINNPRIGLHVDRARGPFAEAVANGMGLYGCAVVSAVAYWTWTTRRSRRIAGAVVLLCLAGTIFTLTRAVWLATVIATVLALLANRSTRRVLVPSAGLAIVALSLALILVPGFSKHAEQRQSDQRPIWDRYNSNAAGIRAVEANPLFGVGWQAWTARSSDYLRLNQNYPLTGTTIEIHNVALSHAAELGLVGLGLWGMAMAAGIGGAILRPGPSELDPWRLGMVALAVHWGVVASFGPLSYPFPNLLLWLWAGVCSIGHLSSPERRTTPVAEQPVVAVS